MGIFREFFFGQAPQEPQATPPVVEQAKTMTYNDVVMLLGPNQGRSNYDYKKDAEEALRNPIVQKCLTGITQAAQQPRWELYIGDKEIEKLPAAPLAGVYQFIQRPNERQTLKQFIKEYLAHMYLAGETFLEMYPDEVSWKRGVGKVYLISPHRVAFTETHYIIDGKRRIPIGGENGVRQILHIRDLNLFGTRGKSPLLSAWESISTLNHAIRHNSSVLQNSGKLGLVAIMKTVAEGMPVPTQEQLEAINRDLLKFSTPEGKGKPLAMSGDVELKELGLTNLELEWLKGMEAMARNISLAFNVDPVLLSLPGDSTYSNKEQANASLFKQTALPKLEELIDELTGWFKEFVPGDWSIEPNLDDVSSLETDRHQRWERAGGKEVLSINERRELLGYAPVDGGDTVPGTATAVVEEAPNEEEPTETTSTEEEGTNP